MRIKILLLLFILVNVSNSESEEEIFPLRIGAKATYSFVSHKASFTQFDNTPRVPLTVPNLNDNSYSLGVYSDYQILSFLSLGLEFAYNPFGTEFNNYENSLVAIDGVPIPIQFRHQLITKLDYLSILPYLKFNYLDLLSLRLGSRLFF